MFLYGYSLFHRIWQIFLLRPTRPNFNMGWTWLTFSRGWMNFGRVWLGRIWQNFGWRRLHQIWTNFGRGRRDQIWAKANSTKFRSGSTWLNLIEFRAKPIIGQISIRVDSIDFVGLGRLGWIWPNFDHNRLSWIRPNFVQGWFDRLRLNLGQD